MGIELVELLSEQLAKPANSCVTENGVSFLEQVICPLYDVIAAVCLVFLLFTIYNFATFAISRIKSLDLSGS